MSNFKPKSGRLPGILLTCFVIILAAGTPAMADDPAGMKTVQVIGTGVISGEGIAAAKQKAILNSLVSAVGMASADILSSDSLVQNFKLLNEVLYTDVQRFVQTYKVLAETRSGNLYRVIVQATVSTATVQRQLSNVGIRVDGGVLPKVLLLISEKQINEADANYWWGKNPGSRPAFSERSIA